jgi:uroporphyrin-3 C-methyltransferase
MIDKIEENTPPKTHCSYWRNLGIFFTILGVVILVLVLEYSYFKLLKVNTASVQMISNLTLQNSRHQEDLAATQLALKDLQQNVLKVQELSVQQAQFISEWRNGQKGDLNKWRVAEAQYLVKLANDQLQFSNNIPLAIILIQEADNKLANIADNSLNEIRKALAIGLLQLQSIPQVDVTALYLRLNVLNDQIDKLPLPFNPKDGQAQRNLSPYPTELPWWKAGLIYSWDALRKIIIVSNNDTHSLPLVMPEEKILLYQNLHAQIENAIWGLLHRQETIYKVSLTRAIGWIRQYFIQQAPETRAMLGQMEALQHESIQPPSINLSNPLKFFNQYHAQEKSPV